MWTTCLLFFQTVLFIGYLYAHLTHAWLRPRGQALLHAAVLAVAAAMLLLLPGGSPPDGASHDPVWQILWLLSAGIGLPYFALAATGPLLQAWFVQTFPGRVPYRLYALSNFGSLLALVSYPFVVEHQFPLPQQIRLWTWGFFVFAILCGVVAARVWVANRQVGSGLDTVDGERRPTWLQYAAWLAWPAAASVVLMATTNQICADVAAIPFLWVAPLALYLRHVHHRVRPSAVVPADDHGGIHAGRHLRCRVGPSRGCGFDRPVRLWHDGPVYPALGGRWSAPIAERWHGRQALHSPARAFTWGSCRSWY